MKTDTLLRSEACALIIGINDYTAFDKTGARNLKGSANDAAAVARLCVALGMSKENIGVVWDGIVVCGDVSDEIPSQLDANDNTWDTRQESIYQAIHWLRGQLDKDRECLLWYSGHGAHKGELLLCPGDTTPGDLSNTIPFSELRKRLGSKAAENLTVVLDCCHGGSDTDHLSRQSTSLGGDPSPEDFADEEMKIGAVVLTACAVGEKTYQSQFASRWHGAFSWALLSVVDQWQKAQQGDNVRMTLTYHKLIKKATVLLDALEFDVSPQIYPRAAGGLAVLQQGRQKMLTDNRPNQERLGTQIDPNDFCTVYTVTLYDKGGLMHNPSTGEAVHAVVLAVQKDKKVTRTYTEPRHEDDEFEGPNEWWWFDGDFYDDSCSAEKITFEAKICPELGSPTPTDAMNSAGSGTGYESQYAVTAPIAPNWQELRAPVPVKNVYHDGADGRISNATHVLYIEPNNVTWYSRDTTYAVLSTRSTTFQKADTWDIPTGWYTTKATHDAPAAVAAVWAR